MRAPIGAPACKEQEIYRTRRRCAPPGAVAVVPGGCRARISSICSGSSFRVEAAARVVGEASPSRLALVEEQGKDQEKRAAGNPRIGAHLLSFNFPIRGLGRFVKSLRLGY
jgi:hypothetical protein